MLHSLASFKLRIPFKVAFKHASAERRSTQTVFVEARTSSGEVGYGEGCPREYVTAESVESAHEFVSGHRREWLSSVHDVETMRGWTAAHAAEIDSHPAAWTAVELAMLDAFGRSRRRSVESLLGLPELSGRYRYTAVLGDAAPDAFRAQLAHYVKAGFRSFKIKLAGEAERDKAKVSALQEAEIEPTFVRADANNVWPDAKSAVSALQHLGFAFFALEEPLPAGDLDGMRRIATAMNARVILDESALRAEHIGPLAQDPDRWIVNVRVSKMGGLLRSLEVLREARRLGVKVIIGAHVGEASVLTRAALVVASCAGDLLVAQEGAFGTHLLERDVTERPIMFGPGGVLETDTLGVSGAPGFGIAVSSDIPLEREAAK